MHKYFIMVTLLFTLPLVALPITFIGDYGVGDQGGTLTFNWTIDDANLGPFNFFGENFPTSIPIVNFTMTLNSTTTGISTLDFVTAQLNGGQQILVTNAPFLIDGSENIGATINDFNFLSLKDGANLDLNGIAPNTLRDLITGETFVLQSLLVPEPSSYILLGMIGIFFIFRKRKVFHLSKA